MTMKSSEDEQFAYNWWGDPSKPVPALMPPSAGTPTSPEASAEPLRGLIEESEASTGSDDAE